MKARVDGRTEHAIGTLILMDEQHNEKGQMAIIGLNGVTTKKAYWELAVELMSYAVEAITNYNRPVPDYEIELPLVGETYKHFKGDEYIVLSLMVCCDNSETRIAYRKAGVIDDTVFDRRASEWFQIVDDKGTTRFTHKPAPKPMHTLEDD